MKRSVENIHVGIEASLRSKRFPGVLCVARCLIVQILANSEKRHSGYAGAYSATRLTVATQQTFLQVSQSVKIREFD